MLAQVVSVLRLHSSVGLVQMVAGSPCKVLNSWHIMYNIKAIVVFKCPRGETNGSNCLYSSDLCRGKRVFVGGKTVIVSIGTKCLELYKRLSILQNLIVLCCVYLLYIIMIIIIIII